MANELNPRWKEIAVHNDKEIKGFFGEYRWLSNFWEAKTMLDGVIYPSSENAYQAAKVAEKDRFKLVNCKPNESKRLWKQLTLAYNPPVWNEFKYDIMASIVFDKFYRNMDLRKKLIATENKHLQEENWWKDTYWGVYNGVGQNNLGKILMKVREFWK